MSTLETQTPPAHQPQGPPAQAGVLQRIVLFTPLLIAAVITIHICSKSISARMGTRYPLDWWESIYIMDAARAAKGLPVYEKFGEGHATHMYGPAGTYVIGMVYWITGQTSIRVGRYLSLVSGIAATIIFTLAFLPRKRPFYLVFGVALFLSLHFRCMGLFTNTRPDITAYLFASIALLLAYRAHEQNQFRWYGLIAALIVLAFLFKQTYAVAALVPPLAVLLIRPTPLLRHLGVSLIPLAAMALTAAILKLLFPLVWFYAIDVPRTYRIFRERALLGVDSLFMHNPLFVVILAIFVLVIGYNVRRDRKVTWLLTSMLIGGVMGIFAFAKYGGNYNSLLMIFGPMTAFCALLLPQVIDYLLQPRFNPLVKLLTSLTLGMMLITTAFSIPMSKRLAFEHASNRGGYFRAIELVKTLDGKVLCPEEPTITLFAKGIFEPSLEAELEAASPRRIHPSWVTRYVAPADWVVTVGTADMVGRVGPLMPELGFERVDHPELGAEYTIWRRAAASR